MKTPIHEISYQDIDQLAIPNKPLATMDNRPFTMIIVMSAIGAVLIYSGAVFGIVLGVLLIGLAISAVLLMKSRTFMQIYDNAIVFYDPYHAGKAVMLNTDEIKEWEINTDSEIVITLRSDAKFIQKCARCYRIQELLNQYIPSKRKLNPFENYGNHRKK